MLHKCSSQPVFGPCGLEVPSRPIFLLQWVGNTIALRGLPVFVVWCGKCQEFSTRERLNPERLQVLLSKPVSSESAFRYRDSKRRQGVSKLYKPPKLARHNDGIGGLTVTVSVQDGAWRVSPYQGNLQVETCWKLCKDGEVGAVVDALHLLVQRGHHIPSKLFCRVLRRCTAKKDLALGRRVHALTVTGGYESNPFLANHLICMYSSHGSLLEGMQVFSKVSAPDVYMWASIILAYARHGQPAQAIALYYQMQESAVRPDNHVFVAVLKACACVGDLGVGKDVHAHVRASSLKPDVFVQSSLVDMYAKCGSLTDARKVFDGIVHRDVVAWNAMIAGYAQQGMGQEALSLYSSMQQQGVTSPSCFTFASLLQACSSLAALQQGKQLHAQIRKRGLQGDVVVGNSLVSMYAKCGSLQDAQRVFDGLVEKDVVTWNAMIGGYAQEGMNQEALSVYCSMQREGITSPNSVTFSSLLQACANMAALRQGKQLHDQIEGRGLQADVVVGTSLVHMYAKCGSLDDAQRVFDALRERDIVAWSALMAGYTRLGDSDAVFELVHRMREDGIQPNGITFLSVLTVCSHGGLLDKGRTYFQAMVADYGVTPTIEHHTCMVDLLGRAGELDEALAMVSTLPCRPDATLWLTLLGACRKWSNVEVGRHAFEGAVRLDEKDGAAYVMMANIYAGLEMWEEAQEMQARRLKCGARKEAGQSWWTDLDGVVHSFVVGERKHSQRADGGSGMMGWQVLKMQKWASLYDLADDEKDLVGDLCGHSEKLAVAYALNMTSDGTTIHVGKNLWVCSDCHAAMAHASKVEKRTIICRDASRVHVYREGKCCCGELSS